MPALKLRSTVEKLRFSAPFRISGFVFEEQDVVVVTLDDGAHRGRGEASGVYYLGDTAERMVAGDRGAARDDRGAASIAAALQHLLPPGGARNARRLRAVGARGAPCRHQPVWELAGLEPPKPLLTTFTLGAETPAVMAAGARRYAQARALKVKLTGDLDARRRSASARCARHARTCGSASMPTRATPSRRCAAR